MRKIISSLPAIYLPLYLLPNQPSFLSIYLFPIRQGQGSGRGSCFYSPRTPARCLYWSNWENIHSPVRPIESDRSANPKYDYDTARIDVESRPSIPYRISPSILRACPGPRVPFVSPRPPCQNSRSIGKTAATEHENGNLKTRTFTSSSFLPAKYSG